MICLQSVKFEDRLTTIRTFRTLDVVFSRFIGFSFQRSSAQAALNFKTEREHASCNFFGPLPQGYYE